MIFVSFGRMGDTYSFDRQRRGGSDGGSGGGGGGGGGSGERRRGGGVAAAFAAAVDGGGVREGEKKTIKFDARGMHAKRVDHQQALLTS